MHNTTAGARPISRARAAAILAIGALAVTGLAACGSDDDEAATPSTGAKAAEKKPVEIAYLVATQAAGYPLGMLDAAKKAAAKDGNAKITVFDAQFDPGKQVAQCQDAVASGKFDAIVTLPAASPPMAACARAAKAADIPLVSANTPIGADLASPTSAVPGVTSQVLVPALTAFGIKPGEGAHDLMTGLCKSPPGGGKCKVGFIEGVPALALTAAAEQNVKKLAAQEGWELVGTCPGGYQRQGGQKCMQDLLQKAPDMNALLSLSDDMALGAEGAMKARGKTPGKDILIGTQGGSDNGVDNINSGRWFGSILSLAEPEGRIPVELAIKAARGEKVPASVDPNKATGMPLVFDQANKSEFPDFVGQFKS